MATYLSINGNLTDKSSDYLHHLSEFDNIVTIGTKDLHHMSCIYDFKDEDYEHDT